MKFTEFIDWGLIKDSGVHGKREWDSEVASECTMKRCVLNYESIWNLKEWKRMMLNRFLCISIMTWLKDIAGEACCSSFQKPRFFQAEYKTFLRIPFQTNSLHKRLRISSHENHLTTCYSPNNTDFVTLSIRSYDVIGRPTWDFELKRFSFHPNSIIANYCCNASGSWWLAFAER